MVARSEEVHRRLQRALSERLIEREYLALVEGRPPARSGTIEAPIGRDPRVRTRMAVGGAGAREASTHFTLERAFADTSLLRLRLQTGRTHQIRVHLRAIGHPVCGDPEYGTPGRLGLQRQFLHATRLAFDHPMTGQRIDVSSPLPEDLRGCPRARRAAILSSNRNLYPAWQAVSGPARSSDIPSPSGSAPARAETNAYIQRE